MMTCHINKIKSTRIAKQGYLIETQFEIIEGVVRNLITELVKDKVEFINSSEVVKKIKETDDEHTHWDDNRIYVEDGDRN